MKIVNLKMVGTEENCGDKDRRGSRILVCALCQFKNCATEEELLGKWTENQKAY